MPRPPLPVGTYGRIRVVQLADGTFRARAKYRDYDGVTRPVERVGTSETKAENRLREALRDRGRVSSLGEITADTKLAAVADLWLRDIDESDKALGTKTQYRRAWEKHLAPAVGALCVKDVRVSMANNVIRAINTRHGRAQADHAKIVLTGIFALAIRHDARDDNPVRELSLPQRKKPTKKIILTDESVALLRAHLRSNTVAVKHDLVDIVDVLSGLGCRIGELLALDWSRVDFSAGTLRIEGTVVRVPKQGLIVQPHTKSPAGMRTIRPPVWVMEIFKRRYVDKCCEWVFPTTRYTLRDPNNTRSYLRDAVAKSAWEGLHPHAFRHRLATRLDNAGLTARQIADYLGHDDIGTTQDVYMDRGVVGEEASQAITEIEPAPDDSDE